MAINMCKAVAELHHIGIIHGDLNSENILIRDDCDVKLIDFDNSSHEGTKNYASGNPDFVTSEYFSYIKKSKQIISTKGQDLYSLGLCCYMLIGDIKNSFFNSLSSDESMKDIDKMKGI